MKSYFRHVPDDSFGVIATPECRAVFDNTGKVAFTGALQSVGVWNIRQGTKIKSLSIEDTNYPYSSIGEVSYILRHSDLKSIFVGYTSGEVRLINYLTGSIPAVYRGHRTAVNCIALDSHSNALIATGGADCDVIVWDLIASAGVARFREHKDSITAVSFLTVNNRTMVMSASKDTLIKIWDIEGKYCLQTILGHRSEVWSMIIINGSNSSSSQEGGDDELASLRVITGSADDTLRGYKLKSTNFSSSSERAAGPESTTSAGMEHGDEVLVYCGSVSRTAGADRCATLSLNQAGNMLAAQATNKIIDFFRVRTADEIKKRLKKRMRREKKDTSITDITPEDHSAAAMNVQLSDELELCHTVRTTARVKGTDFSPAPPTSSSFATASSSSSNAEDTILVTLINNSLEMYKIPRHKSSSAAEDGQVTGSTPSKAGVIEFSGHRSDIRSLALAQDAPSLVSCSAESIRIWHSGRGNCTGSIPVEGYCLCVAFAPGGRYVLAGFKDGRLEIFDAASGDKVFSDPEAHAGNAIWTLAVRPDGQGFLTGSADKTLKTWTFAIDKGNSGNSGSQQQQQLTAKATRELVLPSDVLCAKYNSSKQAAKMLVAVALLDHSIRIFYEDSLKLFLTLYGHSLPVMALDIASDSTLIATGGADKSIKLWGLDFGDCHRSLLGHGDSITAISFQFDTHFFFSSSKDGSVRYWDADRGVQILFLPGHKGTVWSLALGSSGGSVLFSGGSDRSIRRWKRTEELVFVEEEQERMMEAAVDKQAAVSMMTVSGGGLEGADVANNNNNNAGVVAVGSAESLKGTELLMQAIDVAEEALATGDLSDPQLLNMQPLLFLRKRLKAITLPDLEPSLLALPSSYASRLLMLLLQLAQRTTSASSTAPGLSTSSMICANSELEVVSRTAIFLLQVHGRLLSNSTAMLAPILQLRDVLRGGIAQYRVMVGVNDAALKYAQRAMEVEAEERGFYDGINEGAVVEVTTNTKANKKRKR